MMEDNFKLTPDTKIGDLVKNYPYLKDYLLSLSPNFKNLNNSIMFKAMSNIATLNMISERGNFKVEDLIDKLIKKISEESSK